MLTPNLKDLNKIDTKNNELKKNQEQTNEKEGEISQNQ